MASAAGKRTGTKATRASDSPVTKKRQSPVKLQKEKDKLRKELGQLQAEDVLHWMKDGGIIQVESTDTLSSTLAV